jgi:hypothetical protein
MLEIIAKCSGQFLTDLFEQHWLGAFNNGLSNRSRRGASMA